MVDVDDLVKQFVDAAERHGSGMEQGNSNSTNCAYDDLVEITVAIKEKSSDGLRALTPLLRHASPSVRKCAAFRLLMLCTDEAVAVLEEVANESSYVGFDAEMILEEWRKGNLKPP